MTFRPNLILSGGQTGADQGALWAARALLIPTAGWAPFGFKTETGPAPGLADYGLTEHPGGYAARTRANVADAHAVLVIGKRSPGSMLTLREAEGQGRPHLWLRPEDRADWRAFLAEWLDDEEPARLLVAGNRESVWPGIGERVERLLVTTWGVRVPLEAT
jgi:hypothetical protein